jgi:hypothetical protein
MPRLILKNDREIVIEAVKPAGDALDGASPRLRLDRQLALLATKSGEFVSSHFNKDREIVLEELKSHKHCGPSNIRPGL